MSFAFSLLKRPPSLDDVTFVLRVVFTRPGDLIGVIKREAARRKSHRNRPDKIGVRSLTSSWEAAFAAGVLTAPPGDGPPLRIEAPMPSVAEIATALQFAAAVAFDGVEDEPAFAALSLEATRLGLAQTASDPAAAEAARTKFVATCDLDEDLKTVLAEWAAQPVEAL